MTDPAVVLVADDDEDILLLVSARLAREGYEIVQARDGAQALALALQRQPAVAVLDVSMPALDGFEVLERIRSDERLAGVRVVLLTARAQEQDVRLGYELGADRYIPKPFSPAELAAAVAELVAAG